MIMLDITQTKLQTMPAPTRMSYGEWLTWGYEGGLTE
jgi:hypothetical protein